MTARNTTSTSLLRDAITAELHAARHAATKKPARLAVTVAGAAAIGAIAASAAVAPWASAASSTPASGADLTSRNLAVRSAPSGDASGQPTSARHGSAIASAHAATGQATAKHAASKATGPSTIYDSVTPSTIPAGKAAAVYANGTYQASTAQVAGHKKVLWIDTNGSNTHADALDVEPGDATPAGAAQWVNAKLTSSPHTDAIVYTFKSDWTAVQDSIHALPSWEQSHVKYWIADPTGTSHILPGAAATQWYWGASYDISTAHPGFIK